MQEPPLNPKVADSAPTDSELIRADVQHPAVLGVLGPAALK